MAPRRRGRGRGRSRKLAPEQRRSMSVTYTRYVPPQAPPPRELAARWRRVVQTSVSLTQSSTSPSQGVADVLPNSFFISTTSLSGFDAFYLHRVSVWTGIVIPGSGRTVWPTLIVHMCDATGQQMWPSYVDHAPAYNRRARIGLHVPSHMSGPYLNNSTKRFVHVQAYNEGSTGTFEVQTVVIEIDATFI